MVLELQRRDINVKVIDRGLELLEAFYNRHKEFILDRDSSINPYPASVISGNKCLAKNLLKEAGISVVKGEQFYSDQLDDALIYSQEIGFPIVVKPNFGSHGDGVHMDLENLCQVKEAFDKVIKLIGTSRAFLVEEQFEGKEYRVFITENGDYAVLHRDPAHVIGDGKKTIEQLAKEESFKRMNPRTTCLCPIRLDDVVNGYLARSGKDLNFIPKEDEKIYLRHNSNVAAGATCEDYTDKVHPSVIEISKKALEVFHGLPYAGMDFLSKDISVEQDKNSYRVLEVNSIPGIHMHMRPGEGKPRNVAQYLVDMIFPETRT
ncbi:MAG: hypothetical protein ABIB71_03780 [Candidatus Woesearchaeota archaeon]